MKALLKFFLMAYFISWVIWLPLYLPYFGINSISTFPYNHSLGALGPLVAGIFYIGAEKGKSGLYALIQSSVNPRTWSWLLLALISPFVLFLIASLLSLWLDRHPVQLQYLGKTQEYPNFNLLSYFAFNLVFFGFGEEVGWKGYALPRLQRHLNALVATLVFGILWALWHWPLFLFRPGYTSMAIQEILSWFLSIITGSILLTWLFNSSQGSILVCAVFHAAINVVFASDNVHAETINYLGLLLTLWSLDTVIRFGYRDLSDSPRVTARLKFK